MKYSIALLKSDIRDELEKLDISKRVGVINKRKQLIPNGCD